MMNLGTAEARITLDNSQFMGAAKDSERAMQNLDRGLAGSLDRTGRQFQQVGRTLTKGVTLPIVGAGVAMLKTAGDFESGMNRVLAITDATNDEFDLLRTQAIDLSRVTRFTATEVADGMTYLAMAGFEVNEVYAAMPGMLDLAAAAQMDLGRTADIASNIMTGMAMSADEMPRIADVLVATFTNANVTVEMLGDAFKYVATSANQAGWDLEETAAVIGLLGDAGIQATMAGTSMRNWIVRLTGPTEQARKAMNNLGVEVVGLDGKLKSPVELVKEFEGAAERWGVSLDNIDINGVTDQVVGLEDAILATGHTLDDFDMLDASTQMELLRDVGFDVDSMIESMGGNMEFLNSIFQIFGIRGAPAFLALLQRGSGDLETFTGMLREADGAAGRVASTMMRGLNGALLILKSAWQAWMIELADSGPLRLATRAVEGLTRLIERLAGMSEQARHRLLLIAGALALLGPGLMLIGTAMRALSFGMRALGFTSMLGNIARFAPILAVAGAAWLVWDRNLFGIQDRIGRVVERFRSLRQHIDPVNAAMRAMANEFPSLRFALNPMIDGWTRLLNVMDTAGPVVEQFRRVWSGAFDAFRDDAGQNVIVAGLNATAMALRSVAPLMGDAAPIVLRLSQAFRDAGLWVQDFGERMRAAWDAGGIRGVLSELATVAGEIAVNLGNVAVDIAGWVIGQIPDVWAWLTDTAIPAIGSGLASIGTVLVNIAGWAWGTAVDIYESLKLKIFEWLGGSMGSGSIAGGERGDRARGVPIGTVAVMVQDWVVNAATSLYERIAQWVLGTGDGVSGAARAAGGGLASLAGTGIPIGPVAVMVQDWIVSEAVSIYERIKQWVLGTGAGASGAGRAAGGGVASAAGTGIPIGAVAIQITEWRIVADAIDIWNAITNWLDENIAISSADVARIEQIGRDLGTEHIGPALARGIASFGDAITGVFGRNVEHVGGEAIGGPTAGGTDFSDAVVAFVRGVIRGAWPAIQAAIDEEWQLLKAQIIADFENLPQDLLDALTSKDFHLGKEGTPLRDFWDGLFGESENMDPIDVTPPEINVDASGATVNVDGTIEADVDAVNVRPGIIQVLLGTENDAAIQAAAEGGTPVFDYDNQIIMNATGDLVLTGPDGQPINPDDVNIDDLVAADRDFTIPGLQFEPGDDFQWVPAEDFRDNLSNRIASDAADMPPIDLDVPVNISITTVGELGAAAGGMAGGMLGGGDILGGVRSQIEAGMDSITTTIQTKSAEWGTAIAAAIANLNSGGVAAGGVAAGGAAAGGALSSLVLSISASMDEVTSTITTKGAEWGAVMASTSTALGTSAATAFLAVQTAAQMGMTAATAAVDTGANQMSVALLGRLAGMQAASIVAWGAIASAAQTGGAAMAAAAASAAATTAQTIQTGMAFATAAVRSNASQWPGIILGYAGAMRSAGYSVGAAAGQGVASGLLSTLGQVRSAANAIVAEVQSAMTAAARIASPSKLTAYIGQMMGMGLVAGLEATMPQVAAASAAMVQAGTPHMPRTAASYGAGGTTIHHGPQTVHATINAPNGLSESDYERIAYRFGQAVAQGVDLEYTSQGASS